MARDIPTTLAGSAPGIVRIALAFSPFQSGGANIMINSQPYPNYLLQRVQSTIKGGCDAVSGYITQAVPRTAPSEEPSGPVSEPGNNQQATGTSPERDGTQQHPICSTPPTSAAESSDSTTSQPVASGEQFSIKAPCTWTWLTLLIIGVLVLVLVPGLVLGVMTGQLEWGIELSGAIAAVTSFFAGVYYHVSAKGTAESLGRQASDLAV